MEYSYRQLQNLPFNKGGHVAFKQQSSICIQYFMHTKYEILLGSYKTYHLTRVGMYRLNSSLLYAYFMHTVCIWDRTVRQLQNLPFKKGGHVRDKKAKFTKEHGWRFNINKIISYWFRQYSARSNVLPLSQYLHFGIFLVEYLLYSSIDTIFRGCVRLARVFRPLNRLLRYLCRVSSSL